MLLVDKISFSGWLYYLRYWIMHFVVHNVVNLDVFGLFSRSEKFIYGSVSNGNRHFLI